MKFKFYFSKKLGLKLTALCAIFSLVSLTCWALNLQSKTAPAETHEGEVRLPVLMYHLVLKNPKCKNKFIVSEETFEQDLKYIKENGYETILVNDLIEFTEGKKDLPAKPILLTFDDGAFNNYLYAFPLAKKYGMKFVFSPIAKEAEKYSKINDENPSYAHANWNHISEMQKSGLVEIQNHTYDMHQTKSPRVGCTKNAGESKEIYREKLSNDVSKAQDLIEKNIGFKPTAFFYPFGACSKCSEEIIKSLGFKATFLCESKMNYIKRSPDCLYRLHRFIRPQGVPSKTFFANIEKQTN